MPKNKESSHLRILKIIETIAAADQPLSPSDIAYDLDIPKPTVHRLIAQLKSERYVQTNPRGNIVSDVNLNKIAFGIIRGSRYKAIRESILNGLSQEIDETCGISVADGVEMVYYDQVFTNFPIRINLPTGSRVPIYATASGKLYLSQLTKAKRQKILSHLPMAQLAKNTHYQVEDFEAEFKAIRKQGYAIDNEEFIDGLIAIAVPIRDSDGTMTSSLFIHSLTVRKSLEDLKKHLPLLQETAQQLSDIYEQH
ncbi:MAG: IclR family transcriptional regulator [Alphaproteobacteria bacterium]